MDTNVIETTKKSTAKSNVPTADLDFGTLLNNVSSHYATFPLQLPWMTAAQAAQLAADYQADLQTRLTEGGKRKPITQQLKDADTTQNEKVAYVKNYFMDKYGKKNAPSYYSEMGLEKINTSYQLPVDRDRRLEALRLMIEALTNHGFITQPYGANYWTTQRADYKALTDAARDKDSTVSNKVSSKNNLRIQGKTFLNAVIALLKACYPNDYPSKLREWGFQKEKY